MLWQTGSARRIDAVSRRSFPELTELPPGRHGQTLRTLPMRATTIGQPPHDRRPVRVSATIGGRLGDRERTPAVATDRSLISSYANYVKWTRVEDRTAYTELARQAAREKLRQRLEDEVDPQRQLDSADRAKRVQSAVKAHFADLARKSLKARQRNRAARAQAAQDAALDALLALEDSGGEAA